MFYPTIMGKKGQYFTRAGLGGGINIITNSLTPPKYRIIFY
jgi:hypothetical protein